MVDLKLNILQYSLYNIKFLIDDFKMIGVVFKRRGKKEKKRKKEEKKGERGEKYKKVTNNRGMLGGKKEKDNVRGFGKIFKSGMGSLSRSLE